MDWFNQNELRRYPFREDSGAVPVAGEFPPDGLVCDLAMTAPVAYRDTVYLRQLTVTEHMIGISLAVAGSNTGLLVGTFARPVVPYRAYPLTPVSAGSSGFVVFGTLAVDISDLICIFSASDPLLVDERAVLPLESALVTKISKYGGDSTILTGLIKIILGDNVMVSASGSTISIGLTPGARSELVGPCDQAGAFDGCGGVPMRSINGVPGDANGKITLEVI